MRDNLETGVPERMSFPSLFSSFNFLFSEVGLPQKNFSINLVHIIMSIDLKSSVSS